MKPNLKDFPKFPSFAKLPEGDIPKEVIEYCVKSHGWKVTFEEQLRKIKANLTQLNVPFTVTTVQDFLNLINEILGDER